ncbi:MAG: hypothetical protein FWF85_02555 [Clostridiales bacterium]|nr:hypothetical protein [Clostridiales bacterium]
MARRTIDKRLLIAKNMPPLQHSFPGQKFVIGQSKIIKWLISQPEILQYLFDLIACKQLIKYDPDDGVWQGVGYDG